MTRFEEFVDYLDNYPVGYGLGIGCNFQIIDIFFEGLTDEEQQTLKQTLITMFPDVVNFK
jgi:hypothetical protein